jgi:hypothetical protein
VRRLDEILSLTRPMMPLVIQKRHDNDFELMVDVIVCRGLYIVAAYSAINGTADQSRLDNHPQNSMTSVA